MNNINQTLGHILALSRRNPMPLANRMNKLTEETGELAEAVNYHEGWLPHKTMKEPLIGEVADVIITALDVLRGAMNDVPYDELLVLLNEQLIVKSIKWDGILPE